MNLVFLSEDTLAEQPALEWFRELGYEIAFGPEISPGGLFPERDSYSDVVLKRRLRKALARLNPHLPDDAVEDALHQLLTLDSPNLYVNNHRFHLMAVNGVKVEVTTPEGERRGDLVRVFDFDNPANNDFFVANQFTVVEGEHNRRPDVVVFVNGLPLVDIEVKNPVGYERAKEAFTRNIKVYKNEIPQLYQYNEILVASDVNEARHGTLTADWDWYTPWRVIEEGVEPPDSMPELEVMIRGMLGKSLSMVFFTDRAVYRCNFFKENASFANLKTFSMKARIGLYTPQFVILGSKLLTNHLKNPFSSSIPLCP